MDYIPYFPFWILVNQKQNIFQNHRLSPKTFTYARRVCPHKSSAQETLRHHFSLNQNKGRTAGDVTLQISRDWKPEGVQKGA